MPFTREAVEEALDLVAQFAGPTTGIESGRSPRGYAHRVIGTTHTGGPMTFDRYGRQVSNSQWPNRSKSIPVAGGGMAVILVRQRVTQTEAPWLSERSAARQLSRRRFLQHRRNANPENHPDERHIQDVLDPIIQGVFTPMTLHLPMVK
jgi:hypothetical protein